jgi:plasmid stabilization system protein ParE
MSLSVTFRRAARAEFIEAAAWYESQRPDLGVDFIAEIERCLEVACERPMTPQSGSSVPENRPMNRPYLESSALKIGVPKERKFEPAFRNP